MALGDLIPKKRRDELAARVDFEHPFDALHREMDSLFNSFARGMDIVPFGPGAKAGGFMPKVNVAEDDKAVMVTAVEPQSPADLAGIVRGTLIIEANGKPVGSPAEFEAVLAQRGDGVILRILEGKRSRYLRLRRR